MNWKNLKLKGKFSLGFGLVLLLLAITSVWAIFGINSILNNADEIIVGNKLRGEIIQKEVDHLNWAKEISFLFTDDQTKEHKVVVSEYEKLS